MTFLSLESITKSYGATRVLNEITLSVAAGSRVAVVGPSGSGKTTLLRLIAGFEYPDSGTITLGDTGLAGSGKIVPAHRRSIGFVAQDGALFPHLTVADNIGFGMGRGLSDRTSRIAGLMEMVELSTALLDRRPHQLSGGQQQRVALARALARQPKLMLLDEPFSALDTALRASTRKATAELLRAHGIATLLVTHDQAEALSFADQVAVLEAGRLVQVGAPEKLYKYPKDRRTAQFLGEAILMGAEAGDGYVDCALGRLTAATGMQRGAVEIMLRPEQISLAAQSKGAGGEPLAEVIDAEFCGAFSVLTLELSGSSQPLRVTVSGGDVPEPGARVHLTVHGTAHVFEG